MIKNIEDYLNKFKTLTTRFTEFTSLEEQAIKSGILYISKPGKLRFEYLKPKKIIIVLNRNTIMYHDTELEETSYIQEKNYFLKLLSSKNIILQKDLKNVIIDGNEVKIYLTKKHDDTKTDIIITFSISPMHLKEVIFESDNQPAYHLDFYDIEYNKDINSRLFSVQSPKFYSAPY